MANSYSSPDLWPICSCTGDCDNECGFSRIAESLDLTVRAEIFQNTPDSLFYQSLNKLADHIECLIEVNPSSEEIKLKEGLVLPSRICNALFEIYEQKNRSLDTKFLKIFQNLDAARLTKVFLGKKTGLKNQNDFVNLLQKQLVNLKIILVNRTLPGNILFHHLNEYCSNLEVLFLNAWAVECIFSGVKDDSVTEALPCILKGPNLKHLTLHDLMIRPKHIHFLPRLLQPLKGLIHLDLSWCSENIYKDFEFLIELPNLRLLILHGIFLQENAWKTIEKLDKLQCLDVSFPRGRDPDYEVYKAPEKILKSLIEHLPNLVSLDISGTNLDKQDNGGAILGLKSRVDNPLKYLGLYKTFYRACEGCHIPAENISGHCSTLQLFSAALAHVDRPKVLDFILVDIAYINIELNDTYLILELIFRLMDRYRDGEIHERGVWLVNRLLEKISLPLPIKIRVMKKICNIIDMRFMSHWMGSVNWACEILKRLIKTSEDVNLVFRPLMDFIIYMCDDMMLDDGLFLADFILYFLGIFDANQTHLFLEEKIMMDHISDNELLSRAVKVFVILSKDESLVYLMNEKFITAVMKLLNPKLESTINFNAGYILNKLLSYEGKNWTIETPKRKNVVKKMNRSFKNWKNNKSYFKIGDS